MKRVTVYILVLLTFESETLVFSSDIIDRTLFSNIFSKAIDYENESINSSISSSTQTDSNKIDTNFQIRKVKMYDPLTISCGPPPIYIGPVLGLSENFMSNVIQSTSKFSPTGINIKTSTYGYNIGLSFEERLGEDIPYCRLSDYVQLDTSYQSIITNVRYNTMKFSNETSIINSSYNNQMLDLIGREKDSSEIPINYKNEIDIAFINVDIIYKINIFKKLGILAGVSLDFTENFKLKESLYLNNSDKTLKFKKQDSIILDESGRNGIIFNDEIPEHFNFQLALICGIQYEFDVTKHIFISPYFIYGYNVTSLIKNSDIRLSNLNMGMAIHFKL
jgi:hypothetical protein